jgi:hypothetical protein
MPSLLHGSLARVQVGTKEENKQNVTQIICTVFTLPEFRFLIGRPFDNFYEMMWISGYHAISIA